MSIIQRYVSQKFLFHWVMLTTGLGLFVGVISLVENADRLSVENTADLSSSLAYFLNVSAQFAYSLIPLSSFVAAALTGALFARSGENLAILVGGYRPQTLFNSYLKTAMCIAVLTALLGEFIMPTVLQDIDRSPFKQLDRTVQQYRNLLEARSHWYHFENNIFHLPSYNEETKVFNNPVIYRLKAKGGLKEIIKAEKLLHQNSFWLLTEVSRLQVFPEMKWKLKELPLKLHLAPHELLDVAGNPRHLRSMPLSQIISRRKNAGFDTGWHEQTLYTRWFQPILVILMLIVAYPWITRPNRLHSVLSSLAGICVVTAIWFGGSYAIQSILTILRVPVIWQTSASSWAALLLITMGNRWLYRLSRA
ncbi:MAG: LptF/LptG family permease [Myxococcota bacterium]|nr:LptF/LptG family permease [Myxococcota bacterium]